MKSPDMIEIRGARVNNLKDISLDIPLNRIVGIAGVSGSGKSSLAMGVLYAEGSGRYLDALSTYMRNRMSQMPQAQVEDIRYVPAAIALRQRPGTPSLRSTFGTSTELFSSVRLLFSRLASYPCPKCGHYNPPSIDVASGREMICEACGEHFEGMSAEDFSFNSKGACPECKGTRYARQAYEVKIVGGESKEVSLPELMSKEISENILQCHDYTSIIQRLNVMDVLGLGYLKLGEATTSLSGGEAQRLKLASDIGKLQHHSLFIFDEPTIGLHPLDVLTLIGVFQRLIEQGATVVVIEHDTDLIRNADYIVDMGPGGGVNGGRIIAQGTPDQIKSNPNSVIGRYI